MRSVRIWFTKKDTAKYISHLDLTRCLIRAFRRTDIPLWYTEGFNPHPHLVFGLSLPLGVEGENEILDIRLDDESYPDERVISELNRVTVPGIKFLKIDAPFQKPLFITSGLYEMTISSNNDENIRNTILEKINSKNIVIHKKTKKGEIKEINVSEHLTELEVLKESDSELHFSFILPAGNDFTINPIQFKDALISDFSPENINWSIVRKKLLIKDGTEFR
jgi:radical SAM-linked protein